MLEEIVISVSGMKSVLCAKKIESFIKQMDGVRTVEISYDKCEGKIGIEKDSGMTANLLVEKMSDLGFQAFLKSDDSQKFAALTQVGDPEASSALEETRPPLPQGDSTDNPSVTISGSSDANAPQETVKEDHGFLSTGMSYGALSDSFRLGVSTTHNIILEVCEAIWDHLRPLHMPEPDTALLLASANGYLSRWNFPNCVGSIDGKHIRVKCPANSGSMFCNYKGYYLVVLQGLADANYRFLAIEVGAYGKQSDGGVFSTSTLYQRLKNNTFNMPDDRELTQTGAKVPFVILGDEAYPLTPWLMRPFPRRELSEPQRIFNYHLSRGRRVVESSFGILTTKWRILHKPIETTPENVDKIMKCLCILHNVVIDKDGLDELAILETQHTQRQNTSENSTPNSRANSRYGQRAKQVRLAFTEYFCNSRNRGIHEGFQD